VGRICTLRTTWLGGSSIWWGATSSIFTNASTAGGESCTARGRAGPRLALSSAASATAMWKASEGVSGSWRRTKAASSAMVPLGSARWCVTAASSALPLSTHAVAWHNNGRTQCSHSPSLLPYSFYSFVVVISINHPSFININVTLHCFLITYGTYVC
jgi:hypothetical protein